jgi:hypothetical protein
MQIEVCKNYGPRGLDGATIGQYGIEILQTNVREKL